MPGVTLRDNILVMVVAAELTICLHLNTKLSTSDTSNITRPHFPAACAGRPELKSIGWAKGDLREPTRYRT
jgi:hypothetical protein